MAHLLDPRRLARTALFSTLLLASSALCGAEFTGRVTAVHDGDTITVRTAEGQRHRVRLDGIDAPERTQPYSQLSRKNLIALVGEQPVRVESDKVDRHGRPVGVVRNIAGQDLALEQLKAGLAWHFKRYEHEQTPEERAAYSGAEAIAKAARKGLWREESPTPPWEFRASTRSNEDSLIR